MLGLIAAGVTCGVFVGASDGASQGGCSGDSCFRHDPQALQCNGPQAQVLFSQRYTYRGNAWIAQIRWSPECQAGWLRMTTQLGTQDVGFAPSAWNPGRPSAGLSGHSGSTSWDKDDRRECWNPNLRWNAVLCRRKMG
jgi:hypothetical protein